MSLVGDAAVRVGFRKGAEDIGARENYSTSYLIRSLLLLSITAYPLFTANLLSELEIWPGSHLDLVSCDFAEVL